MNMRSPKIALLLLSAVLMVPLSAQALYIQFCTPDCSISSDQQFIVASQPGQTTQDSSGAWTTVVPIATFTYGPFTISATVTSQQASTLQKISFNPTTVIANAGTTCSASSPCKLEIIATSDATDFPARKDAGGYPAGLYMMGSFTGIQAVGNGDTIAMTGTASALPAVVTITGTTTTTAATIAPPQGVNPDVINSLPAADPGNVGVSLPSTCTGNVLCKFMATSLRKAFSTQISETVQQVCGSTETQCLTQLVTHVNIDLKTPGNKVSLPLEHVTTNVDLKNPQINPTVQLAQHVAPQFGALDVNQLSIFPSYFSLVGNLSLNSGDTIDPTTEEVFLRVGDFSLTILPGGFKRLANGKMYKFTGKIDGREVAVTFSNDGLPKSWKFLADVHQTTLTGVPQPPLQVPVQIGVGTDIGSDLVTARFFGN
jgi:hypothetical protein